MRAGIIRQVVESSIEAHLLNDNMDQANERARVARILVKIDRRITGAHAFRDLTVDTEYSVVGSAGDPKRVNGGLRSPDLLIHGRRNAQHNVFVGEVKRRIRSVPRNGPDDRDSKKVQRMLGGLSEPMSGSAPYWLGACINLDEAGAIVFWWSRTSVGNRTQAIHQLDGPRLSVLGTPAHDFRGQHESDWRRWDLVNLL